MEVREFAAIPQKPTFRNILSKAGLVTFKVHDVLKGKTILKIATVFILDHNLDMLPIIFHSDKPLLIRYHYVHYMDGKVKYNLKFKNLEKYSQFILCLQWILLYSPNQYLSESGSLLWSTDTL
jgi:hypothetical protein